MAADSNDDGIDRRSLLAAVSGASVAGLAGCSGNGNNDGGGGGGGGNGTGGGGGGNGAQGERVPELVYEFTTGLGNWSAVEQSVADIASTNIQERLGVPVSARAKEATTMWQEHIHDARNAHLYASGFSPDPNGLDPNYFMSQYHIRYAGNRDGYNKSHYHNCEFSNLAEEQYFSTNEEERRDLVHQGMSRFSEDVAEITTFPLVGYSAINTDQVVPNEELMGELGPGGYNYTFMTNMETASGFDGTPSLDVATAALNTTVHPLLTTVSYHGYWSSLVYSPLARWSPDYELVPDLAESIEVNDDFTEVTFPLKDQTFTNGEPITAEDVVFTYDLYNTSYDGFGASNDLPEGSEVTAVDEQTVRFTFPQPNPTFLGGGVPATYGILPKAHWQELLDDDFSNLSDVNLPVDEIVGSGPYVPTNFESNTILQLEPREDHYNTPNQGLNLRAYTSGQAAYRAFQEGELSIFVNPSGSMIEEIAQKDNRWTQTSNAFTIGSIAPQMSFPPYQFREFRLATSQAINRREASAVAVNGNADPQLHSNFVAPSHPWYPEDHEGLTKIAPSPEGSEETARQTLRDAGYTWDNNGNLRYPPDKDLTPPWPQGESPMDYPDEFPCVENIPEGY